MAQASSDSTTDSPAQGGYYRFPTLHRNVLVFVGEDDLWTVLIEGGVARRLTSNLAATSGSTSITLWQAACLHWA